MSPSHNIRHTLEAAGHVIRSHTLKAVIYQHKKLVFNPLRDMQPMKLHEQWSDNVASTSREDETSRGIDDCSKTYWRLTKQ